MAVILILLQDLSIFIENTWEYIKEFDESFETFHFLFNFQSINIHKIYVYCVDFLRDIFRRYGGLIIIIVKTDKRVSFDFVESSGK